MARPRINITDIARHANCALGSASKALNGVAGVSPEMRERVLKAADELGYIANRSARMLKSGRTWRLGLLIPFASDLIFSRLLDAYHDMALEKGYRLEILFHGWSPEEEASAVKHLIESGVEGIIVHSCHYPPHTAPYLPLLKKHRIPHAFRNILAPDSPPIETIENSFFLDMEKGTEMLAEHLISLGHRRLAMLASSEKPTEPEIQLRIRGIEKAVARHPGIFFRPFFIKAPPASDLRKLTSVGYFQQYIRDQVDRFARNPQQSTAVITVNQLTAWTLIHALMEQGLRVPEDLSVASLALSRTEHLAGFPLTTAEFDPLEVAHQAVAIALGQQAKRTQIPPRLVVRRSTGPVPSASKTSSHPSCSLNSL